MERCEGGPDAGHREMKFDSPAGVFARAWVHEVEREMLDRMDQVRHPSRKGRESMPVAGTHRGRGEKRTAKIRNTRGVGGLVADPATCSFTESSVAPL
eukprot:1196335-Prorocentrum_minimum.AAC.4